MQMRTRVGTSVIGAALLATTGCMVEHTYQEQPIDRSFDDGYAAIDDRDVDIEVPAGAFVGARDGSMEGTVGPAVNINQEPDQLTAYDDGYYISIMSVAQLPERAAMLNLSATNGATLFVPGTHRTFSLYAGEADSMDVYLLGCTGQEQDIYDEYDVPADEVTIDVEEGEVPGEVVVQVAGRWDPTTYDEQGNPVGEPNIASATFTLTR